MLYAFSITLIVTLQLFKAAISTNLQQYQRCYKIHDDLRLRSYDYSTVGVTDVTACLTLRYAYVMIQWLPNKLCLESESKDKKITSIKQVLTLVRVGNKACPGYMSSPRLGKLGASCTKLIGTYAKEECRDLCYLVKSCRAVTYTDNDQTCIVCVRPLGSFQTDNAIGHTSYIRLNSDFTEISINKTTDFTEISTNKTTGYMSSPRLGKLGASCTKLIGTYAKEECRDLCYLVKSCRAVTYTDNDQTCIVCVRPLGSFQTDNAIGHTSYIRLNSDFTEISINKTTDFTEISTNKTTGAWFRKNDHSDGESGVELDHLEHKLVNLLRCAIGCLQEGNCAGFSISLKAGGLHCMMGAGGDSLFLKVSPLTQW